MSRSILPPRKRDWKPGTTQIGMFLRTREGDTIETTQNDAWPEAVQKAVELLSELVKGNEKP